MQPCRKCAMPSLSSKATRLDRRDSSAADLLHTRFIRMAKRRWFSFCMADTTGTELSYGKSSDRQPAVLALGAKTLCCRVDGGSDAAGLRRRGAGQHRTSPRRQSSGQLEFYRRQRSDGRIGRAVRASKRSSLPESSSPKPAWKKWRAWFFSKRFARTFTPTQKSRRDDESFPLARHFG